MACVYLHSAAVRAARLKYPSVLRKGVDSGFKVQQLSSSHQPQLQVEPLAVGMLRYQTCTRATGARFASDGPAVLAASAFFSLQ